MKNIRPSQSWRRAEPWPQVPQQLRRSDPRRSRRTSNGDRMTTMAKPMHKPDDPEQSKRFIEMAREVEASDDAEDFDWAFRKVAAAKRQPTTNRPSARSAKAPAFQAPNPRR